MTKFPRKNITSMFNNYSGYYGMHMTNLKTTQGSLYEAFSPSLVTQRPDRTRAHPQRGHAFIQDIARDAFLWIGLP